MNSKVVLRTLILAQWRNYRGQWGHGPRNIFVFRGPYRHRGPYSQEPLESGPKRGPCIQWASTERGPYRQEAPIDAVQFLQTWGPTDKGPLQTRGPYRQGVLTYTRSLCRQRTPIDAI